MDKEIVSFIDSVKSNRDVVSFDETTIKQTVVMKLLFMLGWDIFNVDEVSPNFPVGKSQVDYCLKIKDTNRVFINVKKANESLDNFQQELFEYASKVNVEYSILTNGILWWFYLTSDKKNFEQKKFCSLDFLSQNPNDIANQLKGFLGKDQLAKGEALESAEKLLKKKHQKLIGETLPEAWTKVISEPHELIVNLLRDTTEKICGFAPEREAVVTFLSDRLYNSEPLILTPLEEKSQTVLKEDSKHVVRAESKEKTKPLTRSYDGKSISSFSFKQKNFNIKSWDDLLLKLCEVLKNEDKQDIEKLLWHSVGKKYYFSRNADELRFAESIKGTEIFVQTHMSPNEMVRIAHSILSFYGYSQDDFSISTKNT